MNETYLLFSIGAGICALVFAFWKSTWINKQDPGNNKMIEIGAAVREGAMAFLSREYKVIGIFVIAVALLLIIGYKGNLKWVAASFVIGALCSATAGFFGMHVHKDHKWGSQGAPTRLKSCLCRRHSYGDVCSRPWCAGFIDPFLSIH